MKYYKILLLLGTAIVIYACNSNSQNKSIVTPVDVSDSPTPAQASPSNTTTREASQNSGSLWHYTCSNGCAGGADSAINCRSCGKLLVHNQAYHTNTNTNTNNNQSPIPLLNPSAPQTGQNAAGVWHYTCSKGCESGSGSAGTCRTCGNTLAHNQDYHL